MSKPGHPDDATVANNIDDVSGPAIQAGRIDNMVVINDAQVDTMFIGNVNHYHGDGS